MKNMEYADNAQKEAVEGVEIIDYIEEFFTIDNKKDPFWENECKKMAYKIWEAKGKRPAHFSLMALGAYANQDNKKIEEEFVSYGIQLPTAERTKKGLIDTFKSKAKKIQEHLQNKAQTASKW